MSSEGSNFKVEIPCEITRYIKAFAIELLVVVVLLICILIIIRAYTLRLREKNQTLYQQLKEQSLQHQIIEQKYANSEISYTQEIKDKSDLFERLLAYLHKTQIYLEPELTREKLALKLGTNRQYMCDAIQEATGQTFNDFINTLRLDYARDLLLNDPESSIEAAYLSAGFSTKSTFYRLFRKKYGLTPTEVKEITLEKVVA